MGLIIWLIAIRFRGTFNGGADAMSFLMALCLGFAMYWQGQPSVSKYLLLYICIQSTLSYFIAGAVKLKSYEWRSGSALVYYVKKSSYDVPSSVSSYDLKPATAKAFSWCIIAFELSVVLVFVHPYFFWPWALCGVLFHFVNFAVLGLNRFFWIWLSTYPVLYYFSQ